MVWILWLIYYSPIAMIHRYLYLLFNPLRATRPNLVALSYSIFSSPNDNWSHTTWNTSIIYEYRIANIPRRKNIHILHTNHSIRHEQTGIHLPCINTMILKSIPNMFIPKICRFSLTTYDFLQMRTKSHWPLLLWTSRVT